MGAFDDLIPASQSANPGIFDDLIPAKPKGGLAAAAKQAIGSTIKGVGQAATDFLPGVTAANPVSEYGQSVIDANPTSIQSLGDIAESPWQATKEAVGNAAGSMGSMLGARALGMGMTAAAPFTGPAAPVVAGAGQLIANVGPYVAAALPSYSGIRESQIHADPANAADAKSKAIALLGAGAVGAIEGSFGPEAWALAAAKKGGFDALVKQFEGKSFRGVVGKGVAKGAAIEGAEELVQNPIEQVAGYQDPTTRQAIGETLLGGAMGAIGGGVIGGGMAGIAYRPKSQEMQPAAQLVTADTTAAIDPVGNPVGTLNNPLAGAMAKAAATGEITGANEQKRQEQAIAATQGGKNAKINPDNVAGPAAQVAQDAGQNASTAQAAAHAPLAVSAAPTTGATNEEAQAGTAGAEGASVAPASAAGIGGAGSPTGLAGVSTGAASGTAANLPGHVAPPESEQSGNVTGFPDQAVTPPIEQQQAIAAPTDWKYDPEFQQFAMQEAIAIDSHRRGISSRQEALRRARTEAADGRVEAQRQREAQANRMAIIDDLPLFRLQNPVAAFENELQRQGFTQIAATQAERELIQRRVQAQSGLSQDYPALIEPSLPNELVLPEKKTGLAGAATAGRAHGLVARARTTPGARIKDGRLLDKNGKTIAGNLTADEIASLSPYVKTSSQQSIAAPQGHQHGNQAEISKPEAPGRPTQPAAGAGQGVAPNRDLSGSELPNKSPTFQYPQQPTTGGAPIEQQSAALSLGEYGKAKEPAVTSQSPASPEQSPAKKSIDLSTRTDEQIATLAKHKSPKVRALAEAEIARRPGMLPKSVSGTSANNGPATVQESLQVQRPNSGSDTPKSGSADTNESGQEDDWLAALFEKAGVDIPSQEAQQQPADEFSEQDVQGIKKAIEAVIKQSESSRSEWAAKVYKKNRTQVELHGDGPSNRESLSIGGINEKRREKAIAQIDADIRGLKSFLRQLDDNQSKAIGAVRSAVKESESQGFIDNWSGLRDNKGNKVVLSADDRAQMNIANEIFGDRYYTRTPATAAVLSAYRSAMQGVVATETDLDAPQAPLSSADAPQTQADQRKADLEKRKAELLANRKQLADAAVGLAAARTDTAGAAEKVDDAAVRMKDAAGQLVADRRAKLEALRGRFVAGMESRRQQAEAQHIEGKTIEPATAPIIAESIAKGARNTGTDLRKEHAALLAEIDAAIAKAPAEAAYQDTVTFDVPGDGKFKVANSKPRLEWFRAKIAAAKKGFFPETKRAAHKTPMQKIEGGMASDETIREMLKDGDLTAALELSKVVGRPIVFGARSDGGTPIIFTDAKPFIAAGLEKFGMASGRSFVLGQKAVAAWTVTDIGSGLSITSGDTRAKAEAAAKEQLSSVSQKDFQEASNERKKSGMAKDQSTLEAEWVKWAEQAEYDKDHAAENERKASEAKEDVLSADLAKWAEFTGEEPDFSPYARNPFDPASMNPVATLEDYEKARKNGKGDEFLDHAESKLDEDIAGHRPTLEAIRRIRSGNVGNWRYVGDHGAGGIQRHEKTVRTSDGREIRATIDEDLSAYGMVREDGVIKKQIGKDGETLTFQQAREQADREVDALMNPKADPKKQKLTTDIPASVRNNVQRALTKLRDIEQMLDGVERARGKGRILSIEVRDQQEAINAAKKKLDEFRKMAPENNVDADAVVSEMGGEPDLSRFGAPAADEKAESATAWHTILPAEGLEITDDQRKPMGYERVGHAIAADAYAAITRDQILSGGAMYAYYRPAADGRNGVVRLIPDDQTPGKPWALLNGEAIRVGMAPKEQVIAKLTNWLRSAPVVGDTSVPKVAEKRPAKAELVAESKPAKPSTGRYVAPNQNPANTEDAGAELTYNRRNRLDRGLKWEDIAGKDEALRVKEATKAKVYPRPNYMAMIAAGMRPQLAHIVKQVYDSISSSPKTMRSIAPSDEDIKNYISGVNRVMDAVIEWANDSDLGGKWLAATVTNSLRGYSGARDLIANAVNGNDAKSLLSGAFPNGYEPVKNELIAIGGNKVYGALQPGSRELNDAVKAIKFGWPESQESWQKQGITIINGNEVRADTEGADYGGGKKEVVVRFTIPNGSLSRTLKRVTVDGTRDPESPEVRKAIEDGMTEFSGRFVILNKSKIVVSTHATEDDAKTAARALVSREGRKNTVSDKGISVTAAERIGEAKRLPGEDISSDKLRETFKFKGVNFGNWMKGDANEKERQLHLNHAYDSFMDLADVLGVPPEAMSLNGMLGVAIGAQGSGGFAAAHFVPGVNEINLTRESGAGSLAHEWGHALDHYFARQAGLTRAPSPFLTSVLNTAEGSEIRQEVLDKFKTIVQAMHKRPITQEEVESQRKEKIASARRNLDGWMQSIVRGDLIDDAEVAKAIERIKSGDLGDGFVAAGRSSAVKPSIAEFGKIIKEKTGRVLQRTDLSAINSWATNLQYLQGQESGNAEHVPQQMVETQYSKDATSLDKEKGGKPYWSTTLEMFARAFDAFVSDTLEAKAAKNTYLSHAGRDGKTVPTGTERTTINEAIKGLVDTLETKAGEDGNVVLYNVATDTHATHADKAIYGMAVEGKTAAEILSFISKTSRRPFNRYLANALRKLGVESTIKVDSMGAWNITGNRSAAKYAAAYNPKTDTVALFTAREAERHALHELTHAATLKAIAAGGQASVQMRALFLSLKRSGALDGQYGMSNLDEFVAEAFSNPKFQQALKEIPAPKGSTLKNAWQWFVRAVARVLGIKTPAMETALDRAMRAGAELMRENAALTWGVDGVRGSRKDLTFKSDIPNDRWLQQQIDYAVSKGKDKFGVPYMGKITGSFSGQVNVPVSTLSKLKGEKGEQSNVRQADLDRLMKIMRETGSLPLNGRGEEDAPYIEVAHDGSAWVSEGNHRIMAAKAIGMDSLPVQIRYFDGGERKAGIMHPSNFGSQLQDGYPIRYSATLPDTITINGIERPTTNSKDDDEYAALERRAKLGDESAEEDARAMVESAAYQSMPNTLASQRGYVNKGKAVLDAAGRGYDRLHILYHGTGANFNTFWPGKSGAAGPGIYLTTEKKKANAFSGANGEVLKVYADIQNPRYISLDERIDAPSINAQAREEGHDGLWIPGENEWVAFGPSQVKSADTFAYRDDGSLIPLSERFDRGSDDIRYNVATDWYDNNAPASVKNIVTNAMHSDSKTSWLTPFNTQYHKAEKWAAEGKTGFKRLFDLTQRFIGDVSRFAILAQNEAPTLFHEVKSIGDVKKYLKSGDLTGSKHKADIDAIAAPLYEGTLYGGGSPLSGVIFSDDMLRDRYGLNDKQITLYHEALASSGTSMDELAKSIVARHAKTNKVAFDSGMTIQDMADDVTRRLEDVKADMEAILDPSEKERIDGEVADLREMDMGEEADVLLKKFARDQKDAEKGIARIEKTIQDISGVVAKNTSLQAHGYFPLMRFGKHTVTAKDEDGKTAYFGMFEGIPGIPRSGQYQANQVAAAIRAEHPEWSVTTGINNDEKHKLYEGMSLEAIQLFAEHMDADMLEPFQEYLREATGSRSVMKRLIHRKGTPGFDRDVRRTLAQFITSNARHTSSSYHMADMTAAAEAANEDGGDIGKEAVRLLKYVQNPQDEAQNLRGFLFFNFLGGSIASAMVNMTQVPMMTFPYLTRYESAAALSKRLALAGKMAVKNPGSIGGALGAALQQAELDGVTAPQEIHQLISTAANNIFAGNRLANGFLRAWGSPFAMAESFNRRATFIASYQIAERMTPGELAATGTATAFEFAEKAVKDTQGIYNKGNRMNVGRGAIGGTLMTFKQYSIMYLELLRRMPRNQQLVMLGLLALSAGGGGLPFVEDLEDIIDTIGQWLGYGTNSKKWVRNTAESVLGRTGADVALNGVMNQMGISLHSRFGMENLIPGTAILKESSIDRTRDIAEFFGPAASVLQNASNALKAMATGHPGRAAMAMAPNAISNAFKGEEMARTGYAEDSQGRRTVPVNGAESFFKGIGFNPKSAADLSAIKGDILQDQHMVQVKREEFTSAIADAILSGDVDARQQALADMKQWNEDNPKLRVVLTPGAVLKRVRDAKLEGVQRFLKTVPKTMRATARSELVQ